MGSLFIVAGLEQFVVDQITITKYQLEIVGIDSATSV
jgi:hypothetical protein